MLGQNPQSEGGPNCGEVSPRLEPVSSVQHVVEVLETNILQLQSPVGPSVDLPYLFEGDPPQHRQGQVQVVEEVVELVKVLEDLQVHSQGRRCHTSQV